MKNYLIFLLIITSPSLFGQRMLKIKMADNTIYKGEIFEYNEDEFKLLTRKKAIITIPKSEVVSPEIMINLSDFVTTIKSTDGNLYKGDLSMENDAIVLLQIAKKSLVTIDKSDIIYRINRSKKRQGFMETTISTKDGNVLVGKIIDKNEQYTIINIEDETHPQKINNKNITSVSEEYKIKQKPIRRALMIVGFIYTISGLFSI